MGAGGDGERGAQYLGTFAGRREESAATSDGWWGPHCLAPEQIPGWNHSNPGSGITASLGAPARLCATIARLPLGFPRFVVAAAEVQLGRCS